MLAVTPSISSAQSIAEARTVDQTITAHPQDGASPRPAPPITAAPTTLPPSPIVTLEPSFSTATLPPSLSPVVGATSLDDEGIGAVLGQQPGGLPAPTADPLHIDPARDPVLMLTRSATPAATFRAAISAAVARAPSLDEAAAQRDEASATWREAVVSRLPVADVSLSTFKIATRAFSNDPLNLLERSRPDRRTDALLHVQLPLIDFGATSARIAAGDARLQAATASVEDVASQLALRAVSVWYSVFGYRAVVRFGDAFCRSQRGVRMQVETQIARGRAAPGDLAQVDSLLAASEAQVADFHRQLANAEAQYTLVFGASAPPTLDRAPVLGGDARGNSDVAALPIVRAARLAAAAAERDVRALSADRLPQLSGAFDAGRYGVVETATDYDVRGSLTLSLRLGGGAVQRVDAARARANGATARYNRTTEEATRDATIAATDVVALEEARGAIEVNYIASRRARDVLAERFRVARGTLVDLLNAQTNYFAVAARYLQTVVDLDTGRYVLLARTGKLLATLGINPPVDGRHAR